MERRSQNCVADACGAGVEQDAVLEVETRRQATAEVLDAADDDAARRVAAADQRLHRAAAAVAHVPRRGIGNARQRDALRLDRRAAE